MRRVICCLLWVGLAWALVACGEENDDGTDKDIGQSGDRIDAQGGAIRDAEGLARLDIPAGAFASPVRVFLETRSGGDGAAQNPIVRITTDPPLTAPLPRAILLSFPGAPEMRVARWMERPGQAQDAAGPTESLAYWRPLAHSRLDASRAPVVWLAGFSEYTLLDVEVPEVDLGSLLDPPETPDGLRYVGVEVVIDSMLAQELSSVPQDRPHSPEDTILITSQTLFVNGIAHDVIVAHIFEPATATAETCEAASDVLAPPTAPSGMCYVGYDLVINHAYEDGTVPMDYTESPTDISVISSHSETDNHMLVCDIVVRHLFTSCPDETPDPSGDCDVFWTAELKARVSFSVDRGRGLQHYSCEATASWVRFPIVPWDTRTGDYPLEHCYYDYRIETGWSTPSMDSHEYALGSCNDPEVEDFWPANLGIMDDWDHKLGDPDSLIMRIQTTWPDGGYHASVDEPIGQYLNNIRNRSAFTVEINHRVDPAYHMPEDYLAELRVTFRPVR